MLLMLPAFQRLEALETLDLKNLTGYLMNIIGFPH